MKRKMCSLILAIVTFIAAYMIMSFCYPRIPHQIRGGAGRGLCGNAENPLTL